MHSPNYFQKYFEEISNNLNSIEVTGSFEEGLIEEICNELVEDVFNKSVVNW